MDSLGPLRYADTPNLRIGYYDHGPSTGWPPVILSHGFPYDPAAYDKVVPILLEQGARVIIPYLRGFGQTTYHPDSPRSGQQAALGQDIIDLMDSLKIRKAILGGFDWGGLASTVAAILYPDRVLGLVTLACYDVIDRGSSANPRDPMLESSLWYQHLFQSERGRQCLEQKREDLTRLLWRQWSPTWDSQAVFEQTRKSFQNPDFVPTVIHHYRFAMGSEEGLKDLSPAEDILSALPDITVPSITIDGRLDVLKPGGTGSQSHRFKNRHEHWTSEIAGHALPYEDPEMFARAIMQVRSWVK